MKVKINYDFCFEALTFPERCLSRNLFSSKDFLQNYNFTYPVDLTSGVIKKHEAVSTKKLTLKLKTLTNRLCKNIFASIICGFVFYGIMMCTIKIERLEV
jgi:hypothetical protein